MARDGSGDFPDRVTLQALEGGQQRNSFGELIPAVWAPQFTRWAKVLPFQGREYFLAQQVQSDVSHTVRLRYDSQTRDIKTTWRLLYGSRVFEIRSAVDDKNEHKVMILLCVEAEVGSA